MPLNEKGNASWTPEELAHLVGKELSDAYSLSAAGGGPLPYTSIQISSKMRYMNKQVKEEPDTQDGEFEPVPKPSKSERLAEAKKFRQSSRASGEASFAKMNLQPLQGSFAPTASSSGYNTPLPISAATPLPVPIEPEDSSFLESSEDDEEIVQAKRLSLRHKPTSPHPPSFSPPPIATPSRGWDALVTRTVSPVRMNVYPNAIELDTQRRCPWIDLFIHKDWVKILVDPVPPNTSVRIDTRLMAAYVIIADWTIAQHRPVSQHDASRSARPSEFVFKFDFSSLGVDLGVLPQQSSGYNWVCFAFDRIG